MSDFLVFARQAGEEGVRVRVAEGTVWLTQEALATLFDKSRPTIREHLKNIFEAGELREDSVCRKFRHTADDGKNYQVLHYNLDVAISVGYRANSLRATQFRQWATGVLSAFARQGYVLDKERLKNGQVFGEDYFDRLLETIREIRMSERLFYQKVTDLYATATDYSPDAPTTRRFYASVQNKLHYAVHRHTAAELIFDRADASKAHMGLTTWAAAPGGKILRADVRVDKNYLTQEELRDLERLVSMYLDYAERQAERRIPMTMEDWAKRFDGFIEFNGEELLTDSGKVFAEQARLHAESEYERFRVIQDKAYVSDFDRLAKEALRLAENA